MPFREPHCLFAHLFVVSLEFRVHHLNCSHFRRPKIPWLLFDCEVHQVFPLFRDKASEQWNVSHDGVAVVDHRGGQRCFEMAIVQAMGFGPFVFLHFCPEAEMILWGYFHGRETETFMEPALVQEGS